jgi:hypothetical protein
MNLAQQRAMVRLLLQDKSTPPFWSNAELDVNLNAAQSEAAERSLALFDEERFTINVEAGVFRYRLDQQIIAVKSAAVVEIDGAALDEPITMPLADDDSLLSSAVTEWHSCPAISYRIDRDGFLILSAKPSVPAVLQLSAWRYPDRMEKDSDEPEIPERDHLPMLQWAIRLCYLKQDVDTFDPQGAERADAEFSRVFGPPKSVQDRRRRLRKARRSPLVQY